MDELECPLCAHVFKPRELDDGLVIDCPKCKRSSMMRSEYMASYGIFYYLLALPPKQRGCKQTKEVYI